MRLILLSLVAACSFEHGVPVTGGGDLDGSVTNDAPLPGQDATVVPPPPMDAPPCADDDADGVCNTVDDWPCGAKPVVPSATMTFTGNNGATQTTITAVELDSTGRLAVSGTNENLSLAFDYDITDTACPGNCIDQIEIGWVPGNRTGCVFDDAVSKQNGEAGSISVTIRTPNAKAVYDLRVNLGQNFSCNANGSNGWWGGTPAATRTIAKLCVH